MNEEVEASVRKRLEEQTLPRKRRAPQPKKAPTNKSDDQIVELDGNHQEVVVKMEVSEDDDDRVTPSSSFKERSSVNLEQVISQNEIHESSSPKKSLDQQKLARICFETAKVIPNSDDQATSEKETEKRITDLQAANDELLDFIFASPSRLEDFKQHRSSTHNKSEFLNKIISERCTMNK